MHDIPIPSLAAKLRAKTPVFGAWIETPDPAVTEALLREGFDTAVLDMQHGSFDVAKAIAGIAICALTGKPALVRVPVGDFATASRMLDAGAAAVVAPMINSAAEAQAFVASAKYPPMGERSWGPGRATALSGLRGQDYLLGSNAIQLAFAMIETRAALDEVDAILAVPGIDGVFVGPSDLSIGLSAGRGLDPASAEVNAALDRIAASAEAAQKFAGLFCFSGTEAKAMAGRGFGLTTIATDLMLLRSAARAELEAAR